jgi:hypothetical protein
MPIDGDLIGRHSGYRPNLAEERLNCRKIPRLAQPYVRQGAVPFNSLVERPPLTQDVRRGLVHGPAFPNLAVASLAEGLSQEGGQLAFRHSYRCMRHDEGLLETHIRQLPSANRIPNAPEDHQTHDISGIVAR